MGLKGITSDLKKMFFPDIKIRRQFWMILVAMFLASYSKDLFDSISSLMRAEPELWYVSVFAFIFSFVVLIFSFLVLYFFGLSLIYLGEKLVVRGTLSPPEEFIIEEVHSESIGGNNIKTITEINYYLLTVTFWIFVFVFLYKLVFLDQIELRLFLIISTLYIFLNYLDSITEIVLGLKGIKFKKEAYIPPELEGIMSEYVKKGEELVAKEIPVQYSIKESE